MILVIYADVFNNSSAFFVAPGSSLAFPPLGSLCSDELASDCAELRWGEKLRMPGTSFRVWSGARGDLFLAYSPEDASATHNQALRTRALA